MSVSDALCVIWITVWPDVRRKHLYPELPVPRLCRDVQGTGLTIRAKRIVLSQPFIENLTAAIPPHKSVEALLDHAVSRYLYCPWNLATHLKLYGEARQILHDKRAAHRVTEAFMDIAAGTRCVSRVQTPLPDLYSAVRGNWLTEQVKGILQIIWRQDLGATGDQPLLSQLSTIPYLDRSQWISGIRRFACLLQPHLCLENPGDPDQGCLAANRGLEPYTAGQISAGLKELAGWVRTPAEFMRVVADFELEAADAPSPSGETAGIGRGPGQDAALLYYMKLAENYRLPVRRMPLRGSGATYPHHHTAWEIGRPCRDIDPWTSFGKIMPGITQVWQRQKSEILSKKERIPDLIVMIDSSSSMRNPVSKLSYAVLGAGCAADAYLRNGARVAVYNFSDAGAGGKKILPWSTNRRRVFRSLCHYIGGGTRIVPEDLNDLQVLPCPDIFLITDMQILNLSILVDYFNASRNRVTVVHMGPNTHVHRFSENTEMRSEISVFGVVKRQDIPKIVLGKVREYLGTGFL